MARSIIILVVGILLLAFSKPIITWYMKICDWSWRKTGYDIDRKMMYYVNFVALVWIGAGCVIVGCTRLARLLRLKH